MSYDEYWGFWQTSVAWAPARAARASGCWLPGRHSMWNMRLQSRPSIVPSQRR
mgnify:CR=1 FL=1